MSEYGILYSNENKWPTATYNMDELHQHNWRKKSNIKHITWVY